MKRCPVQVTIDSMKSLFSRQKFRFGARILSLVIFLTFGLSGIALGGPAMVADNLVGIIGTATENDDQYRVLLGSRTWVVHEDLFSFYQERGFRPVWLKANRL